MEEYLLPQREKTEYHDALRTGLVENDSLSRHAFSQTRDTRLLKTDAGDELCQDLGGLFAESIDQVEFVFPIKVGYPEAVLGPTPSVQIRLDASGPGCFFGMCALTIRRIQELNWSAPQTAAG